MLGEKVSLYNNIPILTDFAVNTGKYKARVFKYRPSDSEVCALRKRGLCISRYWPQNQFVLALLIGLLYNSRYYSTTRDFIYLFIYFISTDGSPDMMNENND